MRLVTVERITILVAVPPRSPSVKAMACPSGRKAKPSTWPSCTVWEFFRQSISRKLSASAAAKTLPLGEIAK